MIIDIKEAANYLITLFAQTNYKCKASKLEKLLTISQFDYIFSHIPEDGELGNLDDYLIFRDPIIAKTCGCGISAIAAAYPTEICGFDEVLLVNIADYNTSTFSISSDDLIYDKKLLEKYPTKLTPNSSITNCLEKVFMQFGKLSSVSLADLLNDLSIHKDYMEKNENRDTAFDYKDIYKYLRKVKTTKFINSLESVDESNNPIICFLINSL